MELPAVSARPTEYQALVTALPIVLNAIPGAVYVCDHDGRLVCYNNEAAQLWGRQPELTGPEDLFYGSQRLFLPDGTLLPLEDCPMARTIRTGVAAHNAEVVIERPDGSRVAALVNIRALRDHSGNIQGAINCFQDISAQKALEKEVLRKNAELEDFFENGAIGLHIVSNEGVILRANKAELDFLGYTTDEYLGRHIAEFHADRGVIDDILHRLSCGQNLDRHPARLRAKDGAIKHVLITSNSRFDDGKFVNTRCFTTDVTDLYEAERSRDETKERLAATYEAANIGIAEADAEGHFLRVNDALCKMLGRPREELLTMTFCDYAHEADRKEDMAIYARQVRGELDNYAIRKRAAKPDGTWVYLDVYSSSVKDASGAFRYGVRVVQDVSEAKLAGDRLRESERRMRDLIEALPAAVYTTDAEGCITFYNKASVEMSGRIPELGEKWCVSWRLYNPDGTPLPHDQCPMAIALKEDRAVRGVEAVAQRPDGTCVPFIPYPTPLHDADGKLIGGINMLVDITDRKRAEEHARLLASIVEFSDDAIISMDTNGVIRSWNKGAERLYKYTANEIIGKPVQILIPADRQDEEPEMILDRIGNADHIEHYETVRMRKDGSPVNISLTVSPLRNAEGHIVGASKIARDITERVKHEESRKLLINELNHRVKNTLATVQSIALQTFREKSQRSEVSQFESRLIALSRAHNLLTQENWEGLNLHQLIEQIVASICIEPAERFVISGPVLRLDPKMAISLAMAIHELCTNAAKYGALVNGTGRIKVNWRVSGQHMHFRWQELDGPTVTMPQRRGFGSRLLERAVCRELGAKVALSFDPSGVVYEIDTPL